MGKFNNVKSGDSVELQQESIIVRVPEGTVYLTLNATVVDEDGNTKVVSRNLTFSDVMFARKYFKDEVGDEDYDGYFVLTDEGKEYLKQLEEQRE